MGCLAIVLFVLAAPLVPFLAEPLLALVPAAWFGWRGWRRRRRGMLIQLLAASAWAGFAFYERRMPAVDLEDAAELRLDLLLVAPLLWVLTVVACVAWRRAARAERQGDDPSRR